MQYCEANFDGLVGPTHNYAGLSFGNVASYSNANAASNPKEAALQGLKKMKALSEMGLVQGVLAPQERPDIATLRRLGFSGSDASVLEQAGKQAREIFLACCSASSMWTANAATVSPSADTADGKVHFTPANLTNKFHRSLEPQVTGNILKATFANSKYFAHHTHLPDNEHFGDEGAANHTRLCSEYGHAGVEIFVYGRHAFRNDRPQPKKFPARQTFHNSAAAIAEIQQKFGEQPLHFIEVKDSEVSVQDAIKTYLFNTQLVTLPDGNMTIIAPSECQENPVVEQYLAELVTRNTPVKSVNYFDVKQSMRNGGGPACLRLRVALTDAELAAVNPNTLMNDELFGKLNNWVEKHYRDVLTEDDLRDPQLLTESRTALDQLTQILKLGSVYPFQQA